MEGGAVPDPLGTSWDQTTLTARTSTNNMLLKAIVQSSPVTGAVGNDVL